MRTMQRVMERSKASGRLRLSERITQLEAALADAHARVSEYERAREIVPEQLRGRAQRLEADVGWLRELRARRIAAGREPDDEPEKPMELTRVGSWCSIPGECTCDPRACRPRNCDGEPARDCPVGGNRVCPIPPACTCELLDSSRDELPDGGPCPLSGWVAPRPGDGCPVHGDDDRHR
jgi:hypothetical protein